MKHFRLAVSLAALCALVPLGASTAQQSADPFTMDQVLSYSFVPQLVAAEQADRIAWVRIVKGVRNVWVADGPSFTPRQVTQYTADDGQEITQLTFSPDGNIFSMCAVAITTPTGRLPAIWRLIRIRLPSSHW